MSTQGPGRWARIEALLDAALDSPAAERDAVLDAACGADVELRREVERLLRSIESAGDAFEHPPAEVIEAATTAAPREQLEPGDRVGAYRVIGLLGRGGMGAVYLAERADGAFDRQVALKVVKRGMDTDEILARFRRERQILARLEHPHIAGLLDGGVTDAGVPYFAMELARGQPIDEWCDTHRLGIEQRLRLFLPVCDAVRHAHRSLIVHRDLKPGNILIVEGEVKLLDFGIAKVLHAEGEEDEPATRLQERRLTPQYAAPEQLRNEPATTATDVYSLGVVLYELLTGRPPYHVQGGIADIERIVCTQEPRSPSSSVAHPTRGRDGEDTVKLAQLRGVRPDVLRSALHGDLDAIVMKALEKEPERRYPSVEALAEDIRRHLSGRPVEARPASQWYRIRKFVGRNRALAVSSAGAATALVLGAGLALWQADRARAESLRAQEEAERSAAARDYLIDLFSDLNPDALEGRRTFTLDELIALSVANLASLHAQPVLQASVMNAVGSVVFNLGDYDKADSLFTEAAAVLGPHGASPELAASMMGLGEVERRRLGFDSAVASFERALEIRRATLPPDDPRIAESMRALAFAYYNNGADSAAADLYGRVLRMDEASTEVRAAAFEGLGDIEVSRARRATDSTDIRAAYAAAVERYDRSAAERGSTIADRTPDVARALWGPAEAHSGLGDHARAIALDQEALAILIETYGLEHPDVYLGRIYFGIALGRAGQPAAAAEQFGMAAAVLERLGVDAFVLAIADAYAKQGFQLLVADRPDEARSALHAAESIYADHLAEHAEDAEARSLLARVRHDLGLCAVREARWTEAEQWLRGVWSEFTALGDTARAGRAAADLAGVFENAGRPDSAAVWRTRDY